ncbi:MAG: hypothetical protein ACE365_05745 [Gammaproteobacteria bacterium]
MNNNNENLCSANEVFLKRQRAKENARFAASRDFIAFAEVLDRVIERTHIKRFSWYLFSCMLYGVKDVFEGLIVVAQFSDHEREASLVAMSYEKCFLLFAMNCQLALAFQEINFQAAEHADNYPVSCEIFRKSIKGNFLWQGVWLCFLPAVHLFWMTNEAKEDLDDFVWVLFFRVFPFLQSISLSQFFMVRDRLNYPAWPIFIYSVSEIICGILNVLFGGGLFLYALAKTTTSWLAFLSYFGLFWFRIREHECCGDVYGQESGLLPYWELFWGESLFSFDLRDAFYALSQSDISGFFRTLGLEGESVMLHLLLGLTSIFHWLAMLINTLIIASIDLNDLSEERVPMVMLKAASGYLMGGMLLNAIMTRKNVVHAQGQPCRSVINDHLLWYNIFVLFPAMLVFMGVMTYAFLGGYSESKQWLLFNASMFVFLYSLNQMVVSSLKGVLDLCYPLCTGLISFAGYYLSAKYTYAYHHHENLDEYFGSIAIIQGVALIANFSRLYCDLKKNSYEVDDIQKISKSVFSCFGMFKCCDQEGRFDPETQPLIHSQRSSFNDFGTL